MATRCVVLRFGGYKNTVQCCGDLAAELGCKAEDLPSLNRDDPPLEASSGLGSVDFNHLSIERRMQYATPWEGSPHGFVHILAEPVRTWWSEE